MKGVLKNIIVAVKGACMGAADVIPGVSGGTIAFIMGIYDDFVGSLAAINGEAVKLLFKGQFKAFWKHINGSFLMRESKIQDRKMRIPRPFIRYGHIRQSNGRPSL